MRPEPMRQFEPEPEDGYPLWIKVVGFVIGKAVRHWRGLLGCLALIIMWL